MSTLHQFFCVVANGLEGAVSKELESIGLPAFPSTGGVYTKVSDSEVKKLTRLRTPTAIRWQLINGRAVRSLSDFRKLLDTVDWSVFPKHADVRLQVRTRKSKLNRSDVLDEKASRILKAILGHPKEGAPILPVVIRMFENKLWVSVALHDRPLHQRGWRESNVKTPIRENWAQCLQWLADCKRSDAILDPFCGSGTMLIESGMYFANRPIFKSSPWVFDSWGVNWTAAEFTPSEQRVQMFGSDRDEPSVHKTRHNATAANIDVSTAVCDIRTLTRATFDGCPDTGVILCNPPYGMGSGNRTDAVYHWLGQTHRNQFPSWRLYFIATDARKASLVSKDAESVAQFSNAGIPVTFYGVSSV